MYKVFIVDDDYTVRQDLGYLLAGNGKYRVVGEAENGEVALERIAEAKPDIVLLDIEMPVMDGLTAIPRILQSNADYKIVVLSCHDDYDNVRFAMRIGAAEYLLKQRLEEDTLFKALDQMADLIEVDRRKALEQRMKLRYERIVQPAAMNSLVTDMIQGHVRDRQLIRMRVNALHGDFVMDKAVVCCLRMEELRQTSFDSSQWKEDQFVFALENMIGEMAETAGHTLYGKLNKQIHYLIVGFREDSSYLHINNFIYELSKGISTALRRYLKLEITIGVSPIFDGATTFVAAAEQACLAAEYSFYMGNGAIIHHYETEKYRGELEESLRQTYIHRLMSSLQEEESFIERTAREIANEIKVGFLRVEAVKSFHMELLAALRGRYNGSAGVVESLQAEWPRMNMEDYGDALSRMLGRVRGQSPRRAGAPVYRGEIVKALEFLDKHYKDISSLDEVAAHVHLNKSYFSQLFKKETNETFTNYLTRLRMEKAKEMLADSDIKIYEIAQRVGMDNYRYFCKVFKEVTDLTPMEFRKQRFHM